MQLFYSLVSGGFMKNKTATGLIRALSHDGRGIAQIEGKTVFIESALVGEQVEFEYTRIKSRYSEAKLTQILSPSSARIEPKCNSFGICGGCSLQHMDTDAQLNHKLSVLLEQLYHIGGINSAKVLPAIKSTPWGYRRKARLGVRYVFKEQKLLIGFREKNGRYLADITDCSVLDESIGAKIEELRVLLLALEGCLAISQLEVAVGDNAIAIIIRHLQPFNENDLAKLIAYGTKTNFHIYLQPGNPTTVSRLYPAEGSDRLSYHLKVKDQDLEMLFHPSDFIQVNAAINNRLIDLAIELMAPQSNETFLDLFCGIGNFTLPLSLYSQQVIGIEGCQEMVKRGYENARHNGISNVIFECHNLQEPHYTNKYISQKYDGVLLDPPRTGALEIVKILPKLNAKRVVYISCNPATLSRDAGHLRQHGYELVNIGILDMFPHTSHVESIGLFVKK